MMTAVRPMSATHCKMVVDASDYGSLARTAKDLNRKIHDDFLASSRQNLTSCKQSIIQVREKLASMDIGAGVGESDKKAAATTDNHSNSKSHASEKNDRKNGASKSASNSTGQQKPRQLVTQRSSTFEGNYLSQSAPKRSGSADEVKKFLRRHSETSMWSQFSRDANDQVSWPADLRHRNRSSSVSDSWEMRRGKMSPPTSSSAGPSPGLSSRRPKPRSHQTTLPRLAIVDRRRNSDPVASKLPITATSTSPPASSSTWADNGARGFAMESTDGKQMGEMYHGSLFRVLRHSMSAFGDRPQTTADTVWRRSSMSADDQGIIGGIVEGNISSSPIRTSLPVRKPQPPSTPRRSSCKPDVVSPHQLDLILRDHEAKLTRRPYYFRSRTTTI